LRHALSSAGTVDFFAAAAASALRSDLGCRERLTSSLPPRSNEPLELTSPLSAAGRRAGGQFPRDQVSGHLLLRLAQLVQDPATVDRLGAHHGHAPRKAAQAHRPSVLDRIWAHNVRIGGRHGAVEASVPYASDVTVGLHCSLNGPIAASQLTGRAKGAGLYSRIARTLADWVTSRNLRGCDFGPH
jgi:hypothetical protein